MRSALIVTAILILAFSALPGLAHEDRGRDSKEFAYRAGYEDGYRDGVRHGRDDYRRGIGYDLNSKEYKNAGKNTSVKHKGDYKKGFREGYQVGYREGYGNRDGRASRYPGRRRDVRYPDNRYPYPDRGRRNLAFDMGLERGYHDGREKGEEDLRKNRRPDVIRHGKYRDADDAYKSSYGEKLDYQRAYREGFERGYRERYGGYRFANRAAGDR